MGAPSGSKTIRSSGKTEAVGVGDRYSTVGPINNSRSADCRTCIVLDEDVSSSSVDAVVARGLSE